MYAIVDIETTGGYASANGITEIAIYVYDGTRITRHFETLVNPLCDIPHYITALTGINNEMVQSAPTFSEIAADVFAVLDGNIFVAHNVNFDYSFVNHQLRENGFILSPKKLCTVRLSRKVIPGLGSYSLGNLCRSLQIPISGRHRAGGDAKATVCLLEYLLERGAIEHIDQMLKKKSGEQWLPLHLAKAEVDALPQTPGVYYFHDCKGKIIYVGKAVNIRKRVISHFSANDAERKRQGLQRDIYKITYRKCGSELEAIVLESAEIKSLWPRYNRSQKQPGQKFALYLFEDRKGYLRLAIDKKKKNLDGLYHFNYLPEGEAMLRKLAEEFELHEKLCFIDKHSLAKADNIDTVAIHNLKMKKALAAIDERLHSFAIVAEGLHISEKLCLLMERGSFWGMGYIPESAEIKSLKELKDQLIPYNDNDTIRNCIYSYIEQNPGRKILLTS